MDRFEHHIAKQGTAWVQGLTIGMLFLLGLGLRIGGLDRFLTADEWFWFNWGRHFSLALLHGDWAQTVQGTAQPGVTTMWSATIGFLLRYLCKGPSEALSFADFLARANLTSDLLPFLRLPAVLLTASLIPFTYWLVRPIFGRTVALSGAVLLALNPFFLAHSRLLHHDATATVWMTITILSLMRILTEKRAWPYLILSGAASGLALLSKSSALFLFPFVSAALFASALSKKRAGTWTWLRQFIIAGGLWFGILALTVVICWPAMWVAPISTLQRVWSAMIQEGFGKHSNFLLGQVTREPNALYYPVAFLLRTTPATLPGIFVAMVWLWWRGKHRLFANNKSARIGAAHATINTTPVQDVVPLALLAYICSFVLYMSVASKKFDRYILPIFPVVDLLAAWGWNESFRRFVTRKNWRTIGIAVLFALQIWSTVSHYPYYLTAYNPLFGGTSGAARAILVGWGEGLDLVADYLNNLDNAEGIHVVGRYGAMVLRFLCKGSSDELLTGSDVFRGDYDYLVFYINQVQRQIPDPETVAYWQKQEPVCRVRLHGLDYAWVYHVSKPFPHTCEIEMGRSTILLGYGLDPSTLSTDGVLRVTLYWDADKNPISPETMKFQILSPAEEVWSESTQTIVWPGPTVEAWLGKRAITDVRGLRLLPGTPPGIYRVEATSPGREDPLDLSLVEVPRLPPAAIADLPLSHSQTAYLNGTVKLLGYELNKTCTPGGQIRLILYWQALETPDRDYTIFTHVLDGASHVLAQQDNQPVNNLYSTSQWLPGEIVRDPYTLVIAPDTPPGTYRIEVGMYDSQTLQRVPAFDSQGQRLLDDRMLLDTSIQVRP